MEKESTIDNAISTYLLSLCDQLQNGQLSLNNIPLSQLQVLVAKCFSSVNLSVKNPSCSLLLEQSFALLSDAITSENLLYTVNLLQLLALTIIEFHEHDRNWNQFYQNQATFYEMAQYTRNMYSDYYSDLPVPVPFQGKGVIYTAITGSYDNIHDPEFISNELDYVCFTDNPEITSDIWQIRLIDNPDDLDLVRLARYCKIFPYKLLPEYDYSIWIDGKLQPTGDLTKLISTFYRSSSMLCFPHYQRDCLYEEAKACILKERDDPSRIRAQMARYQKEQYPAHNGLVDSAVLFRSHHNPALKNVMETWWTEIRSGSYRDQLSFNYACWKHKYSYDLCNFFIYLNPYVKVIDHNE